MNRDPHTISLRPTPPQPQAPAPLPVPPGPRRPRRRSRLNEYLLYALVIGLLAGGVYTWFAWSDWFPGEGSGAPAAEQEEEEQQEIDDLVAKVGELIILPEGEVPTIATVTDPEKLRDQVFFANAQEGDKVLIYTKAQKAYLYDPRIHKLREVAPLTIQ